MIQSIIPKDKHDKTKNPIINKYIFGFLLLKANRELTFLLSVQNSHPINIIKNKKLQLHYCN